MKVFELAKKLEGFNTIEDIEEKTNVSRQTAVNYICKLRKFGIVETGRGFGGKRLYKIEAGGLRKIGNSGLVETINSFSDMKLVPPVPERYMGKKLTKEEAFLRAVKSDDFRLLLAAIQIFKHEANWSWLAKMARELKIGRRVGALYFASRRLFRARSIKKRYIKILKSSKDPYEKPKNMGFKDIEKEWKVSIPFGIEDSRRAYG